MSRKRKVSDIGTAITVAHLGAAGSFSEQAAESYFSDESRPVTKKSYDSFTAVFNAIENEECKYGLVPIENSDSGSFSSVYDLLSSHKLMVVGEYTSSEEHCLCALPGVKTTDITQLFSHPKALDMCGAYIKRLESENKSSISLVGTPDTVQACSALVTDKNKTAAAIASRKAAVASGLEVLVAPISNDKHIMTRYIVLSREPAGVVAQASQLKGTLCVSVKNEPGALFKVLSCFAFRGINVLQMESRPSSKALDMFDHSRHWEKIHFIDFEPSNDQKVNSNLLSSLQEYCIKVRDFGIYRQHNAVGSDEYTLLYK